MYMYVQSRNVMAASNRYIYVYIGPKLKSRISNQIYRINKFHKKISNGFAKLKEQNKIKKNNKFNDCVVG